MFQTRLQKAQGLGQLPRQVGIVDPDFGFEGAQEFHEAPAHVSAADQADPPGPTGDPAFHP